MTMVAPPTCDPTSQTPIANLAPSSPDASSHVLAQVVLVWPYSSSTRTLALLLADPDIRKRKSKGQVKVIFRHGCAREVAKTKVGIGDVLRLGLVGCEWTETGDAVSTPGKKVEWDLEYQRRVVLQVLRDDQDDVAIDYTASENDSLSTNGTNGLPNGIRSARPSHNGVLPRQSSTIHVPYLTPQKQLRSAPERTFVDAAWDSLVEEDGYVPGHGRKRTKFARNSGAWSLVDADEEAEDTPSAAPATPAVENGLVQQQDPGDEVGSSSIVRSQGQRNANERGSANNVPLELVPSTDERVVDLSSSIQPVELMASPPRAPSTPLRSLRLDLSREDVDSGMASPTSDATTTPRLHPIPSPGLSLVSPLIQRAGVGVEYFPLMSADLSQLEASAGTTTAFPEVGPDLEIEDAIKSPHSDGWRMPTIPGSGTSTQEQAIDPEPAEIVEDDNIEITDEADSAVGGGETRVDEIPRSLMLESSSVQDGSVAVDPAPQTEKSQSSFPTEIAEDDDMYGPPIDPTDDSRLATRPLSIGLPISPLDALELFLQLSPSTAPGPSNHFEASPIESAPTAPLHPSTTEVVTGGIQPDQIPVSIILRHSSLSYPEVQSPFRQKNDQQASSNTSSRPSSAHRTRIHSLDGNMDEQGPFAEYINHLSQITTTAQSAQHLAAEIKLVRGETQSNSALGTDPVDVSIHVNEAVHPGFTKDSAGEALQDGPPAPSLDAIQVERRTLLSRSLDVDGRGVTANDQLEFLQTHEAEVQLPTPDLSQLQYLSPDLGARILLKHNEIVVETALPSPQHTQDFGQDDITQEDLVRDALELSAAEIENECANVDRTEEETSARNQGGMMQLLGQKTAPPTEEGTVPSLQGLPHEDLQEPRSEVAIEKEPPVTAESAVPKTSLTLSNLDPDSSTPLRSSQRLSARKSIMTSNISSPYFTPRKADPVPPSSPIRKENVRFSTPDRASLPSSPAHGKNAVWGGSATEQDVEQEEIDLTLVSPNLRGKRPISRRHAGTTTPLAYYAHLSSLQEYFGQTIDVLAVCTESSPQPKRATSGPKDYYLTLRLADSSLTSTHESAVPVQIFRHTKTVLPTVSIGDVVILRNFKVQTSKRRVMLLSTDTSSWAVFQAKPGSSMSWSDVVVSGPPIEYGSGETSRVKLLFSWWTANGNTQFSPQQSTAEGDNTTIASPKLRSRSPRRKEVASPPLKAKPASRRREDNMTDHFDNESAVENFFASFANGDDVSLPHQSVDDDEAASPPAAPDTTRREANETDNISNGTSTLKPSPRASRRKGNMTDHFNNEDPTERESDRQKSAPPLTDATRQRRQSTISLTAASESGRTSFTPRRSARNLNSGKRGKSPSLVHELRDGTKYVDGNEERKAAGSVVHELRDGVTYVDE